MTQVCSCWHVGLWHMPHSIVLLATLKNNDNCYLLFEQPYSHYSHATSCASLSLASSSHNLHTVTKSLHSETFYAKNQLLAKNSISSNANALLAPHSHLTKGCQHLIQGALPLTNLKKN